MKSIKFLIVFLIVLSACKPPKYSNLENGLYADIQTSVGDILVSLHYLKTPMTVANFVALAEGNHPEVKEVLGEKSFYTGIPFHRVIPKVMVQAGVLNSLDKEKVKYFFSDELSPDLRHDKAGVLSMANLGKPYTNATQFFITNKPTPWLDGFTKDNKEKPCGKYGTACHTVFGNVLIGHDLIDSIKVNDIINNVKIIRVGNTASNFNAPKIFSKLAKETIPFAIKKGIDSTITTNSGLKTLLLQKGTGLKVNKALPVTARYTLYTIDGVKIYSSTDKDNKPIRFTINEDALIAGWKEGASNMYEGEKTRLFIPSYLGYGSIGQMPLIAPNTDLILEIEIIKVGK